MEVRKKEISDESEGQQNLYSYNTYLANIHSVDIVKDAHIVRGDARRCQLRKLSARQCEQQTQRQSVHAHETAAHTTIFHILNKKPCHTMERRYLQSIYTRGKTKFAETHAIKRSCLIAHRQGERVPHSPFARRHHPSSSHLALFPCQIQHVRCVVRVRNLKKVLC